MDTKGLKAELAPIPDEALMPVKFKDAEGNYHDVVVGVENDPRDGTPYFVIQKSNPS